MAERTKALVSKTSGPLWGPVGSNPTPSADTRLLWMHSSAPARRRDRCSGRGSICLHLPARCGWLRTGQSRAARRRGEGSNPTPSADTRLLWMHSSAPARRRDRCSGRSSIPLHLPARCGWLRTGSHGQLGDAEKVRIPLPPPTRGCCGCTPRRLLGAETVVVARLDFPSPPGSWWLAADKAVTGSFLARRRFESHSLRRHAVVVDALLGACSAPRPSSWRGSISLHLPARCGWLRTGQSRAASLRGEGSNPTPSADTRLLWMHSSAPARRRDRCPGEPRFPSPPGSHQTGCGQGSHRQLPCAEKVRIPLPPPTRGCCGCTPRRLLGAETVALGEARFPFTSRLVVAGCGQGSHRQLGDAEKVRIPLPPPTRGGSGSSPRPLLGAETVVGWGTRSHSPPGSHQTGCGQGRRSAVAKIME